MKFINPYNFVPVGKSVKREVRLKSDSLSSERDETLYTGVIEYTLLTKTPLIIPNTSNPNAFGYGEDHKSYDFYSYTDLSLRTGSCEREYSKPVIPGSEMRGMLRSNYEILTNSCLSSVDEKRVLARRSSQVFEAGLIKRNGDGYYSLYKATDCIMRTMGANSLIDKNPYSKPDQDYKKKSYIQDSIPEGSKVFFQMVRRGKYSKPLATKVSTASGTHDEGYILKGAEGPVITGTDPDKLKQEKHCAHVFVITQNLIINRLDISVLKSALTEYRKALSFSQNTRFFYDEYSRQLEIFEQGLGESYFPVYYSRPLNTSNYVMLSPASITREIYQKNMTELLGSHRPCDKETELCPACRLFGTVRDSFSAASRIRVCDLEYISGTDYKDAYEKLVTLPELSSPKLSNVEFYLKRPDKRASFWTYDYYMKPGEGPISYSAEINGRKIYWHHRTVKINPDEEKGKRNMTVRPLKAGKEFRGKLYFSRITKDELDTLIYLINVGEESDKELSEKKHGYKLGAAKPIGFGSITLKVDKVLIRKYVLDDLEEKVLFKEEPYIQGDQPDLDKSIKEDFNIITDFNAIQEERLLHYPYLKDKTTVYEWFVWNHAFYDYSKRAETSMPNRREQMVFRQYMEPMKKELTDINYKA